MALQPGKRLGAVFLEKVFQLSVSLPRLDDRAQAEYWRSLLRPSVAAPDPSDRSKEREAFHESLKDCQTEGQVLARLEEQASSSSPDLRLRGLAVSRLAEMNLEGEAQAFLDPFAPLLEPNPRAMKRLLHAYAIGRAMALLAGEELSGDTVQKQKLALRTILGLRWPVLEHELWDSPEVERLLATPAVQAVLRGEGVRASLDPAVIGRFSGAT